jgi:hypothetical protein
MTHLQILCDRYHRLVRRVSLVLLRPMHAKPQDPAVARAGIGTFPWVD